MPGKIVTRAPTRDLTPREKDVIRLLLQAYTDRRIAEELGIAETTVSKHLQNLFTKFGAKNRTELALLLQRAAS